MAKKYNDDPLNHKEIDKPKLKEAKQNKPKYRYVCDACTGIAFVLNENDPVEAEKHNFTCKSCGKRLGKLKKENFIELK
jgi:predicted nucleic acid-binding Zn ribbon protein